MKNLTHLVTSIINSGMVTILTSLAMTYKAIHMIEPSIWIINWLISWFIVCNYVYWVAPKIARKVNEIAT